ncbi:MAG: acyl-CoA dehydrogenase family protein, partial [Candidatus Dormibacteria bacterium]
MKLEDSAEEAAFRTELKDWLASNLRGQLSGMRQRMSDLERGRSWSRALFDAGYAGLTWPKEYG